jgi:hypothetical protein
MIDLKSAMEAIKYNGGTSPLEGITRFVGTQQQAGNAQQESGQRQGQLAGILSKILMSGGTPVA